MRRYFAHGTAVLLLVGLVVASTGGVSEAKGHHLATPGLKSALNHASVAVGSTAIDTATLLGKAKKGSPTGTITFFACGPTTGPTPCTSPNFGPDAVSVSAGAHHSATATESITPPAPGWYCFLDEYNGDAHYEPVSDNNTATECLEATGSTTGPTTPTLTTALSSSTVSLGSEDVDTATVTGSAANGSPSGTVTFSVCGPTATATACTSSNGGSASVALSPQSNTSATASVIVDPGGAGWYCLFDQYSGDSHYTSVTDNNTATECFDVTGSTTGPTTPTLTTALGSSTVSLGSEDVDTATVTGSAANGSPSGTVTFSVCGPTATATACTSPNGGSASVALSPQSNTSATASVIVDPGGAGWYCLFDQYSGDSHYTSVTDNNTATECFDVTGSTTGPTTPTLTTALSSSTVSLGSEDVDTATVTGSAANGSPSGTVTFSVCGPTATATACTSPNGGSASVALSPQSNTSATASVIVDPGGAGWYCLFDQYSGDSHYTSVTDNNTATECFDVTGSTTGPTTPTLTTSLSSSTIPFGSEAMDTATVTGGSAGGSPTGTLTFSACGPTAHPAPCTSPNIGPATAELSPESNYRSVASVTIGPGAPGWYCFLDQYNGDAHYASVTDNDTTTECLDVTGSSSTVKAGSTSVLATGPTLDHI